MIGDSGGTMVKTVVESLRYFGCGEGVDCSPNNRHCPLVRGTEGYRLKWGVGR